MTTAIVMSGGGAKGAHQVGMLRALEIQNVIDDNTEFYGTSVGAINAFAMSRIDGFHLENFWLNIDSLCDIARPQWKVLIGRAQAPLHMGPLRRMLEHVGYRPAQRPFTITYTELTGRLHYYKSHQPCGPIHDEIDAVLASACYPVFMQPVENRYTDGGVREIVPLHAAMADGHSDIYVLLASPRDKDHKRLPRNPFEYFARVLNLQAREALENDLTLCLGSPMHQPKIHIVAPETAILGSLQFKRSLIQRAIGHGYEQMSIYLLDR